MRREIYSVFCSSDAGNRARVRPQGTLVIVSIRTVQYPLGPGLRPKSLIPTEHCVRHGCTGDGRSTGQLESVRKEKTAGTHLFPREFVAKQGGKKEEGRKKVVDA